MNINQMWRLTRCGGDLLVNKNLMMWLIVSSKQFSILDGKAFDLPQSQNRCRTDSMYEEQSEHTGVNAIQNVITIT